MGRQGVTGIALGTLVCAAFSIGLAIGAPEAQPMAGNETVVKIVAQRFSYTPNEIVLHRGQPAILEFRALDFTHGFTIPDLGIRADLPPGQVIQVRLTPEKTGVYDFLCDNFCGAGHEQMSGKIIVQE
jgi:cytochrome c oxidase subunit 2